LSNYVNTVILCFKKFNDNLLRSRTDKQVVVNNNGRLRMCRSLTRLFASPAIAGGTVLYCNTLGVFWRSTLWTGDNGRWLPVRRKNARLRFTVESG